MDGNTPINSDELYHYGIKGMKWGVLRTPEQLGHYLKKVKRFTKRGSFKIPEQRDHYLKRYATPLQENVKTFMKSISKKVMREFVPGFLIINSIFEAGNFINGLSYFKKEGPPEKVSDLKKKNVPTSTIDDMKKVNPRIVPTKGTVKNCGLCVAAMEMRARGYDVRARKRVNGITEHELKTWFNGLTIRHPRIKRMPNESRKSFVNRSYDNLCTQIEKFGNGTRGYVGIQYEKIGGGHSLFWTVTDGRVTFYDGQNNKSKVQLDKIFALADPEKHSFARLDNYKVKKGITEAVISVDDKTKKE